MSTGIRLMIVIGIILILLLIISGNIYPHPINIEKLIVKTAIDNEKQSLPEVKNDCLFFAQNFNYITMYGDPMYWDDEKNMSVDIDSDGKNDLNFIISQNKFKGINLVGSVKQSDGSWKSTNFWSADLYKLFRNSLQGKSQEQRIKADDFLTFDIFSIISLLKEEKYIVKCSSILYDDYVQLSTCDIDEDGLEEVLASVGNQFDENVTAIYEFSNFGNFPFDYCGYIYCDTVVEYKGDHILWAYHGNLKNKLYDIYNYDGKRVKKVK